MSFANRHTKATSNIFTYQQAEDATFCKCKELYDHGYTEEKGRHVTVRGCFVNESGKFGPSAALICEGFNVNLPSHMVNEIKDIMASPEDVADINAGRVGAYAYEYTNSRGGKSYSIRWTDLPGDINNADLPY